MFSLIERLAPQSGHVPNFYSPIGHVIELVNAEFFQQDSGRPQIKVYGGHPDWKSRTRRFGSRHAGLPRRRKSFGSGLWQAPATVAVFE